MAVGLRSPGLAGSQPWGGALPPLPALPATQLHSEAAFFFKASKRNSAAAVDFFSLPI